MQSPETIPPTPREEVAAAVKAISADPATLAVLYVHQGMRLESMATALRAIEAECAELRIRAVNAEATVDVLRERLKMALERVEVLGGAA